MGAGAEGAGGGVVAATTEDFVPTAGTDVWSFFFRLPFDAAAGGGEDFGFCAAGAGAVGSGVGAATVATEVGAAIVDFFAFLVELAFGAEAGAAAGEDLVLVSVDPVVEGATFFLSLLLVPSLGSAVAFRFLASVAGELCVYGL